MKLKILRDWINTLSEEFMEYDCVYSVYDDSMDEETKTWTRNDKLITSCYIDEGHTECTFSSNRPEALCNSEVKERTKLIKKSTNKKAKKQTKK